MSSGKNIGGPRGSKGTSGLSHGIKGGVRSVTGGQARRLWVPGFKGEVRGVPGGQGGPRRSRGNSGVSQKGHLEKSRGLNGEVLGVEVD